MLSLNKTKSIEEMKAFIGDKEFITMLKMDGLTCSLGYKNGYLVSAETRGNGVEGEDILHNIKVVKNVPHRINCKEDITIDGEIICTYDNFKPFKDEYANPRNFASGSIRLLDSKESAKRNLSFVAWDVIGLNNKYPNLHSKLMYLTELGFDITAFQIGREFNQELIDEMSKWAKAWSYPIDGLVVKYNDCAEYDACGRTEHHFKGGMAFKFTDEEYETYLLDIEWTMGRTGVLTPVAIFEPVDTGDSVIERASLHNISVMKDLLWRPYKGQSLMVCKMNDIIPQVVSAGREISSADFEGLELTIPTVCPICGGSLQVECEVDSEVLICTNDACEGKLLNKLEHFCSKKGLDIKGLSKATLEKLMNWGWVNNITDIMKLSNYRDEWIKQSGFGEKSVDNILNSIESAKHTTLETFLSALGIPLIGLTVAKDLVKHIPSYEEFRSKVDEKFNFSIYDGFAEAKTSALQNYDYSEADEIYSYLTFQEKEATENHNSCKDLKVVITGRLNSFKNRDAFKSKIEECGGRVVDSVSGATSVLVNNDVNSTSSKNKAARDLGIPILSEEEFIRTYLTF